MFGTVRKAKFRHCSTATYAIKTIEKRKVWEKIHLLKSEVEVLRTLDHPNI